MVIAHAKKLKIGQTVHCPADRGDKGFSGKVVHVGETVYSNHQGTEYVWVTVQGVKKSSVWPSNRLG